MGWTDSETTSTFKIIICFQNLELVRKIVEGKRSELGINAW